VHEREVSGGFDIQVTDVHLTGDLDAVSVDILSTEPGEGCIVTDTLSAPFVFYRLDTRVETVDFNERTGADRSCQKSA